MNIGIEFIRKGSEVMKNWEKYLRSIDEDIIVREIADKRLRELNPALYDPDSWSCANFVCDNAEEYYWPNVAIAAEIEWLKQEAEDEV